MIKLCSEFGAYDFDIFKKRGVEYTPQIRSLNISEFEEGWDEFGSSMLGASGDIQKYDAHDITAWRYCGCTLKLRSLALYTPMQYPWNEIEIIMDRCCIVNEMDDAIKLIIVSID